MAERPYISVVILTSRRQEKLKNCLRSLKGQIFHDFEVIVVDNNPSTETESIIRELSLDVRLINNPGAPSYAEARNKGIEAAQGEFIAFIDDDCVADPAWLLHFSESAPDVDAIGGLVLPLKNLPFPDWWEGNLNWLVGLSVPGLLSSEFPGKNYPQTANMIIRREILFKERFQELGGGFSHKQSRRYAGREDVELWRRLRLKGRSCAIEPKAIVYHDIPIERLRFFYLVRRAFNDGLAYYRREKKTGYYSWAVTDIITRVPGILSGLIPGKKKKHSSVSALLWSIRQIGFLFGYNSDGLSPKRLGKTSLLFFFKTVEYILSRIKRIIRKQIVRFHHNRTKKRRPSFPPKDLLIAACGYLGDMILLAPIFKGLRDSLPNTKITLLGYNNAHILFRNSGLVDELILCPFEKEIISKRKRKKILGKSLNKRHFDAAIVPYYHNAPPDPLYFSMKAPVITFHEDVGFPRKLWYDLAHKRIKKDYSLHEIRNLYRLVSELGVRFKPQPYRLSIPEKARGRIDELLKQRKMDLDSLILLHAGAGQFYKAWPLDNWDTLARMIYQKFEIKPAFIGDESVGRKIENLVTMREGRAFNLCGTVDITGLAALIQRGILLITNDSGPKHLAMTIGTPTISLYGTTDERRWGALWDAESHVALRAVPPDVSPEEILGLPPDYSMACITPEMIMEVLEKYMSNIHTA